jgi:acyl carrier protein
MDRGKAFTTFQDCVAEVLDIDAEDVRASARWREDLDADSLAVVEITLALNDAFHIKIPDVDPEKLTTVGQAFDVVANLVGVSGPVSPAGDGPAGAT